MFGKDKTITSKLEEKEFSGLQIAKDPIKEGQWYVKGNCYNSYLEYWNNLEAYTEDQCGYENGGVVESVDINSIEGIYLSSYESDNPKTFWSIHKTDGTLDTFLEIASHIPEVQSRLDAGVSLEALMEDEVLGTCAGIYFNPESSNAPRIVKGEGFYRFDSNGRHRIIAARILGYNFPIKIVGRIIRK